MRTQLLSFCIVSAALNMGLGIARVHAQITPDGSLSTVVTQTGNSFTIDQGDRVGNNLFHSFSQFSVPTGGAAIFNNAVDVQNIFSRVTGGTVSNIDGAIRANGVANLFLLNPSGILFGPNASLNMGGSFIGTTANSIKFADGIEFSAVNSSAPPLLTMSVPIGLQMGQNPGPISVQGPGHRLAQPSFFYPIIQPTPPTGLGVGPGNTLALIGGAIALEGGILLAPSGHIELGSLSNGSVGINTGVARWEFNYGNVPQFADIRLAQQALVDASGAPAGSLHLQGRNISLLDGTVARLQNLGGAALGDLVVDASGLLEMRQVGTDGFQNNLLSVENLGTGAGSNLRVSAQQLSIQDGGVITTKTFSAGSSGNITINVRDAIALAGWSALDPTVATAIGAATLSTGKGGDLSIASRSLTLTNGASVLNLTAGLGLGGNITVKADESINVVGENPIIFRSSEIANTTLSQGNGGNLTLTASHVMLRAGGAIGTSTLAAGNGGILTIAAADSIEISGTGFASAQPSRIVAKAELLPAILRQAYGLPDFPTGNAGMLVLSTARLQVSDQAIVGVDNQGHGDAGTLLINADRVILDHQGVITAATQSGEGGNLILNLQELLSLRQNSAITTTANGTGNGGNITINAPIIIGLENSDIVANALNGQGGNIQITTQGIFGFQYRNQLTLANDITASSEFGVNGTVEIATPGIDPNAGLVALPGDILTARQHIVQGCAVSQGSSFVVTGRGGIPLSPLEQMRPDRPWTDTRALTSDRRHPVVPVPQLTTTTTPLIQATGWRRNPNGTVELFAPADSPATAPMASVSCTGVK